MSKRHDHRTLWLAGALVFSTVLAGAGLLAAPVVADVGSCPMFPSNNIWNTQVDSLPVDSNSAAYINSIGASTGLHADFGTVWDGAPNGIPFTTVTASQPNVTIRYYPPPDGYADESDPGPFPIPTNAPIEGGPSSTGDRHVLVADTGHCMLYELFNAQPNSDGSWTVSSSAKYDLNSNALRPAGWTSADAAGLPILPGLVRLEEVQSGHINHALRFSIQHTRNSYIWPARHEASSLSGSQYPQMGQRFRLKASFDISHFSAQNQVILTAMKQYGIIVADNGSNWFISGAPNPNWSDDDLHNLGSVHGSDFEAVDESSLMVNADSGQAGGSPPLTNTPTNTATRTATRTSTRTSTPLNTLTRTPTNTATRTSTKTPTPLLTNALTPTQTATRTATSSPTACSSKPAAPTLVSPGNNTLVSSPVTLDWSNVVCATYYKLIVRRGTTSGSTAVNQPNLTSSIYRGVVLTTGVYYWRARACNSLGCTATGWWGFGVQ